jgi:hypothetical protein
MRFKEFITEATKPGFFTVGDSHAAGIASVDKRWTNLAKIGAKSDEIVGMLSNVPEGSTIILSAGHNDSTGTNNTPEEIASKINGLINIASSKKLKVFFLLFPKGNGKARERNEEVRKAIYKVVSSKVSTVFNLDKGTLSQDGIHLTSADYKGIGEFVLPQQSTIKAKPGKGATVSPQEVASYLQSKGLDNNHVLGILANIKGESGFNAGVMGDKGTSGGLFQHHADRLRNMVGYAGSDWRTDWQSQINFALSEPAGQAYVKQSFPTPQAATAWWVKNFEKPANPQAAINTRVGFLKDFT